MSVPLCECGEPAERSVLVSTRPGSLEGRLIGIEVCHRCYLEVWFEEAADLSAQRDVWELAFGSVAMEASSALPFHGLRLVTEAK